MTFCSYDIFLLRDQLMIERLSVAMGTALVQLKIHLRDVLA